MGLGLRLGSAILGGDPNANARNQAYANAVARYKRATIAQEARRSLGIVQYKKEKDVNLDSASRLTSRQNQEWRKAVSDAKWQQYKIYRESTAAEGKGAARGMTGATAKRLEVIRKSKAGISKSQIIAELTTEKFARDAEIRNIWAKYKADNLAAYNRSEIGVVRSVGPAPTRPKGPSFLARLAPILGIVGKHYANQYQPDVGYEPPETSSTETSSIDSSSTDSSWMEHVSDGPDSYDQYNSLFSNRNSLSSNLGGPVVAQDNTNLLLGN